MANQLPVSRLIAVSINLSPAAAQGANLNTAIILGASPVIGVGERKRDYANITAVGGDFGTTAPEYQAANLYFQQTPQPATLSIGRWAKTATAALLNGGLLSSAQQLLSVWSVITNGGFSITVDGTVKALTALNFSAAANMNGVASVISTALAASATCVWDAVFNRFEITSATTGAGTAASATITFSGIPAANDTVTIGGTVVTFVAANPVGAQVLIGTTAAITAANLQGFLQASADVNLVKATYSTAAGVTTITYGSAGTAGNAFTLIKTSTNIAVSGATLTGGIAASAITFATSPAGGTDVSALLGLTSGVASAPANGIAAETPVAAVQYMINSFGSQFLGINFADSSISNAQHIAVASLIEADQKHLYFATSQEAAAVDSTQSTDLGSQLKALGFRYSIAQYSSTSPYAAASLAGRLLTVNFNANNSTITLMYKTETGIIAESINSTQANALDAKNYNYFVNFDNATATIVNGITPSGLFIDTIYNSIWFQNRVQTDVYNLLFTSQTKIPQTDAGMRTIANTIEGSCIAAVNNGFVAPGTWTVGGFGQLRQGDFLPKGYYVYAPPISSQSVSDRAARKSVPFQIALKEAGAVHTVSITASLNH